MNRSEKILVLNIVKKAGTQTNDFADFNAHKLIECFSGGEILYVLEMVYQKGISWTQKKIRQVITNQKSSTVFFAPNGDNYELPIEFFQDLKSKIKINIILLILDDELIFDTYSKYYAQVFDTVVTCDYYSTFAYRKIGIPACYYFSSYSKKDFYPVDVEQDIDVCFIGDCTKTDRVEQIWFLELHGIKVVTYGIGSNAGFLPKSSVPTIFSRSKINLNFTKINKPSTYTWYLEYNKIANLVRQNKGRPMEIALSRAFCLSEYSSSLSEVFEVGREIDMFSSNEELLEKVQFYLKEDKLRQQIAEKAYEKSKKYEADTFFPILVDDICRIVNNCKYPQREAEIYKDYIFKKNHLIQLTFIMYYQLLRGRIKIAIETFSYLFQYGLFILCPSFAKGTQIAIRKTLTKVRL